MGRNKIPDSEKRKRGTFQPVRGEKSGEIMPLSRMPIAPAWICEEGKRIWRDLGPNLLRDGHLTASDTRAFARYCHLEGLFEALMAGITPETVIDTLPNGIESPAQRFKVAMDCHKEADKIGKRFGFDPASRKNVPKVVKEEENPFTAMMKKKAANG